MKLNVTHKKCSMYETPPLRLRLRLFMLLAFLLTFNCCASVEQNRAAVSFTGDIIMHIPVKNCAWEQNQVDEITKETINNSGFDFLFDKIKVVLTKSDEAVGNMEFPVAPPFTSKPMVFNCHPDVLRALKKSGFTVMHLANNHLLDQDPPGVTSTLDYLKKSGLAFLGAGPTEAEARAGLIKTVKGIRIGFIGYTDVLNNPIPYKEKNFTINLLGRKDKVAADIAAIRPLCDYLIMVVHSGDEYALEPSKATRELLRFYIDQGVDLVVGHHPHVLQPAEAVTAKDGRRCHIFYSLGNFISNQSSAHPLPGIGKNLSTRDSAILTVYLTRKEKEIERFFTVQPITTVNYRPWGGKRVIQTVSMAWVIRDLEKKVAESKMPVPLDDAELKQLRDRMDAVKSTIFRYGELKEIRFISE